MTGCCDGSPDFVSFADECEQIEAYVLEELGGELDAVWGGSGRAGLTVRKPITKGKHRNGRRIPLLCFSV